jgi:hypothetical protein
MIIRLFNHAHVLYQETDEACAMAEEAITASVDAGGTIVLEQDGRHICLNPASVNDLCKLLRELRKAALAAKEQA